MNDNSKIDEKVVKGNTAYYKLKIEEMVKYEIDTFKVNEEDYLNYNISVTSKIGDFSKKLLEGADFKETITSLRDEVIGSTEELKDKKPVRSFFQDYIFGKIYDMGINIKNNAIPDDCEKELLEAKLAEEEKQKEEQLKQEQDKQKENEIKVTIDDNTVEKPTDIVDEMWNYFFPSMSTKKSSKTPSDKKADSKDTEEKDKKEKPSKESDNKDAKPVKG